MKQYNICWLFLNNKQHVTYEGGNITDGNKKVSLAGVLWSKYQVAWLYSLIWLNPCCSKRISQGSNTIFALYLSSLATQNNAVHVLLLL